MKKAVGSNPEVQAKLAAFAVADSLRDIAKAGFLPQVDFSASAGPENRTTPTVPSTNYDTSSAKLTVNQILFDGFFTSNEVHRLTAAKRTRYYELLETAENTALEAVKAYADVVRYRELVELATQNYVDHKQSANLVEERVNAGVGRRVDLEQATGRVAQAESNLLTELTNLHDVSARYLRVVGEVPPRNLPALAEPFKLGTMPASAEALMRDGIQNSPTLLAALQNARASQIAIASAKAGYMPRVDLQGYATSGNNNSVAGENRAMGAAVALTYNLFKGGADRANEKMATFNSDQARDLQNKACRDVRQVLSLAYSDVRSLSEKLDYEDRHRLASEKTREAYRQQFEIGQRTLLDLLDTQNEFFQASRSYTIARHDQAAAQARTLAAMGQLINTVGAARADMPGNKESDEQDKTDVNAMCKGVETAVDTVANIKAGLNFGKPEKPTGSYVVLLPDRDNVVGKVIVEGKGGKQVLQDAQQGVKADGGGAAFAVSDEQLKRDFGAVMAALPKAPERFVLYFQRGSDVLTTESTALLSKIIERAAAHPGLDVSVIGHTDTSGSEKANELLGRKRAHFVVQQLITLGLKVEAISEESAGKKMLEVATPDNTREQRNRRVEVILR
ncbi:TolC family outer membrane protein [Rhodoferax sp. GW822-FHT02A01]|uniref:TolC family outer membrane protein n=1 Tax=Rhodoferax sp. GW822-FHT02A01 TaxID=3141537 RepID=UPI00315D4233